MDPAKWFAAVVRDDGDLEEMVALVGATFATARVAEPEAVVAGVRTSLDELAGQCEGSFGSVLRTLFASGRLRGNRVDYGDPRNSFLHEVLATGLGIPITLSVCAIAVGRRVGVPIEGVGLPGHFMIRCDGVYADPFNGGRTIPAGELEGEWQRLTGLRTRLAPQILATTSARSIVVRVLNNLRNTVVALDDPFMLHSLARLRGAMPELAAERAEHARWLRYWN